MDTAAVQTVGTHVVVVHNVVNIGSPWLAGLIGGAVVLIGVVTTEVLVRFRERGRRIIESWWAMGAATTGLKDGNPLELPADQLLEAYGSVIEHLAKIRSDARWPVKDAGAIREEIDEIQARFMIALGLFGDGKEGAPRLGPIVGDKLARLIFGKHRSAMAKLDARLVEAGLPTVYERTADYERMNAPLMEQPAPPDESAPPT